MGHVKGKVDGMGGAEHQQSHCTEDTRMLIHSMWDTSVPQSIP